MSNVISGMALFFFMVFPLQAELIQILHTNDIHSHLDHSIHRTDLGGYSRLKKLIEEQKRWASDYRIDSLVMDAGDFLEGNIYYLADGGKKTYEIHGSIGYDVAVIGNHDYLMGSQGLDEVLRDVDVSFDLLGANFHVDKKYKNINEKMLPFTEKVINGVKVGIVGVTTSEIIYSWRVDDGEIDDEVKAVAKWAKVLRERGNELIIALTHVGLQKDKMIAMQVPEVDLIVGGHSHHALHNVIWQYSKNGKRIPIVQAGFHAQWLGKLLINYNRREKKLEILDYKLLPVQTSRRDFGIDSLIENANEDLFNLFDHDWLSEVVGQSELRSHHTGGIQNSDIWMYFITDSMYEASEADASVHAKSLSGDNYPQTGAITRRNLYNSNPRHFELNDKEGYNVYTAKIFGIWLKTVMKVTMSFGLPLYFTGMTYDYQTGKDEKGDVKYTISNMRMNGKKIRLFKRYRVSFSEGIVRASSAISPWLKWVMSDPRDEAVSMWKAMEDKIRKIDVITEDYLSGSGNQSGHYYHMKFPGRTPPP